MKKSLTLIIGVSISTHTQCQELWIERNVKPIVTATSIIGALAAIKFARSNLVGLALGFKTLDDSDTCKKVCIDEFVAMGIPNAQAIRVKKCELPFFEEGVAQARVNALVIAKSVYESYDKLDFDKDAFRFLVRHEGSHIKNNDFFKDFACSIGMFNAFFYGIHHLLQKARPDYFPSNKYVTSTIKIVAPIIIGYKLSSFVTNLYRSYYEERADREAATDLELAKGGVRLFEKTETGKQKKPEYLCSLITRLLTGRQPTKEREKTLRSYVQKLEQQSA